MDQPTVLHAMQPVVKTVVISSPRTISKSDTWLIYYSQSWWAEPTLTRPSDHALTLMVIRCRGERAKRDRLRGGALGGAAGGRVPPPYALRADLPHRGLAPRTSRRLSDT